MRVTDVPIEHLFQIPLAPVRDGGFAGLLFVICRAADDPEVHLRFFQDWSSIHDVTGRYLAVITPMPRSGILIAKGPGGVGSMVSDVALVGDQDRLLARSAGAVRMAEWDGIPRMVRAPAMVYSQEEHEVAVTNVATELQEFFGVSESLVPCAVIVCPQEQAAFAVELASHITVYSLLKLIKTSIEPVAAQISQKETELAAATTAWRREQGHHQAMTAYREWREHRNRLAQELAEAAGRCDREESELCRWMGSRLRDNNPLVPDEDARAQRLLELLHGRLGSLPRRQRQSLNRRLRRTLAKLNSGYPGQRPEVMGFALVDPGEDDIRQAALSERASQETVMKLKTELHEIYGELRLGPAVAAAAEQLGLQPADSHGLLDWRRSSWPISAFARPKRNNPALRFERA